MSDQAPTNVIAALARVQAEIGGIEKLTPEQRRKAGGGGDERGVTYAYRGIDQIAAAAQPLFGRYGIVIAPTVEEITVDQITLNGKPWTDTTLQVAWTIYGPGGTQDRIDARTVGVGRDNSDKGSNKAITQAYKNLLLRLLTIGDPNEDADSERHENEAAPPPPPPFDATPILDSIRELDPERRREVFGKFLTPGTDRPYAALGTMLSASPDLRERVRAAVHIARGRAMVDEARAAQDAAAEQPDLDESTIGESISAVFGGAHPPEEPPAFEDGLPLPTPRGRGRKTQEPTQQ